MKHACVHCTVNLTDRKHEWLGSATKKKKGSATSCLQKQSGRQTTGRRWYLISSTNGLYVKNAI